MATAGAAALELDYETTDGEVPDLAWAGGRLGVVFGEGEPVEGWTVCRPDVDEIFEALKLNGVA